VLIPPAGDCLAVAAENGLDSFLSAVDSAGLTDALSDSNATYTIFAPSNSAFDAIDIQSIDKDLLASVLKYHVLPITKISSDIKDGDTLSTLEGSDITVVFQYFLWIFFDGAYLNGKSLISTVDLMCSNGVIHIIDEVLEIPA
jgi:transforming growth factor-beta-induced protein